MRAYPAAIANSESIRRFRDAMVAGDLEAVVATFSPGVVLHSPITMRHTFRGRDEVRQVYGAVLAVVDEIGYGEQFDAGSRSAVVGSGTVRGQAIEETMLFGLDADGLIAEITLFVRPMPGLLTLAAALAPHVGEDRRRSRIAAAMIAPLAAAGRSGEVLATRLVWPR